MQSCASSIHPDQANLTHFSAERLEEYLFRRASNEEANAIETHILTCAGCLSRLQIIQSEISLLKAAFRHLQSNPSSYSVA